MAQVHRPSKELSHRALEPAPSRVQRREGEEPRTTLQLGAYISLTIPGPRGSEALLLREAVVGARDCRIKDCRLMASGDTGAGEATEVAAISRLSTEPNGQGQRAGALR